MRGIEDKRIVIAGGGSGIGAATADRLGAEGARLIVGDLNLPGAQETAYRITAAGGTARAVHFDLADEQSTRALVRAAVEAYGGIDGLANVGADLSAGTIREDHDVAEMNLAVWERTFRVNIMGFGVACSEAVRHFAAQGLGGAIVNISSEVAASGDDTRPAYAASKAGVNALTRQIASHWGRRNVRCNSVAPGIILSKVNEGRASAEHIASWTEKTSLGRAGKGPELAAAVAFLLSDEASFITGQVLYVNGGSHFHG
jgi:NAD(P)-dependent dehydrogenase (short-subunit alcohol dehydrogenase family)